MGPKVPCIQFVKVASSDGPNDTHSKQWKGCRSEPPSAGAKNQYLPILGEGGSNGPRIEKSLFIFSLYVFFLFALLFDFIRSLLDWLIQTRVVHDGCGGDEAIELELIREH